MTTFPVKGGVVVLAIEGCIPGPRGRRSPWSTSRYHRDDPCAARAGSPQPPLRSSECSYVLQTTAVNSNVPFALPLALPGSWNRRGIVAGRPSGRSGRPAAGRVIARLHGRIDRLRYGSRRGQGTDRGPHDQALPAPRGRACTWGRTPPVLALAWLDFRSASGPAGAIAGCAAACRAARRASE